MIGIVIPTLNNFKGLAKCLSSIEMNSPYHLFVQPNWRANIGVAASWNKGFRAMTRKGCTEIAFLNDDTTLSPFMLERMAGYLRNRDDVGVVTGKSSDAIGSKFDPDDICEEKPDYACFMIKDDAFETIGSFDENFVPAYFEDNDYHYRTKLAGLRSVRLNEARFVHEGSATQNMDPRNPVVPSKRFEKNRDYYIEKWGNIPGKEIYSTPFNMSEVDHRYWQ